MKSASLKDSKIAKAIIRRLPDTLYLKLAYWYYFRKRLNLSHPETYNEKLQWLKLHDRNPEYVLMVDKYEAKKIIANKVGEQYIIPTLGVWNSWDEIPFGDLPDQFVLKPTHDSNGVVIVRNKENFDKQSAKNKIEASLRHNFYLSGREWPYKDVPPRIIAEQYMEDTKTGELRDYKFFVFNGVSKIMFVASDRQTEGEETKFDFFDMEYNWLPIVNGHPNSKTPPEKPVNFELMKQLSEVLGKGYPHLRVDFYEVNGRVYVGELTLFHWSGLVPFKPEEWDYKMGSWLKLPIDT